MSSDDSPVTVRRIPNPAEPVPAIAVPTLVLLIAGVALWVGSSLLYLSDDLRWWTTIPLNAIGAYLCFTVADDAGHHAASRLGWLNDLMSRVTVGLRP